MSRRSSNRILLIIALVSLMLVALSAIVTVNRDEVKLSPNTPEGVIQLFLKAIIEGKNDQAASYFSADSKCDDSDIDRAYVSDTLRINLVSTTVEGESAYVKVDANTGSGGPFEDGYTESHTYRLIKESRSWRIEGIPWPLWDCGTIEK